jgi:hypothetical protein
MRIVGLTDSIRLIILLYNPVLTAPVSVNLDDLPVSQ